MIQRSKEDRRTHSKGRKNIGRRKEEKYSMLAYKVIIVIMFSIVLTHVGLVLVNLK